MRLKEIKQIIKDHTTGKERALTLIYFFYPNIMIVSIMLGKIMRILKTCMQF